MVVSEKRLTCSASYRVGVRPIDCGCSLIADLFGFAGGAAVADFEHFDLLDPRRRVSVGDVALVRLHKRSGDRRYPAHLTSTEIDFGPHLRFGAIFCALVTTRRLRRRQFQPHLGRHLMVMIWTESDSAKT